MRRRDWFLVLCSVVCVGLLSGWGGLSVAGGGSAAKASAPLATSASSAGTGATVRALADDVRTTRMMVVSVYFMRGSYIGTAHRRIPWTIAPARAAMNALLAGPTSAEKAAGLSTTIPRGTRLLGLTIRDGLATVDLSAGYPSGGGTLSETARLAQVVYTLTQFRTVRAVNFRIEGKPVTVFSSEGILLTHPQRRRDYESVTPAIFVETPAVGDVVGSPLTVAGTVNTLKVFEAQFVVKLVTSSGKVLARKAVIAAPGGAVRRPFRTTLLFSTTASSGKLIVFDISMKTGQAVYVVRIPLGFK